MDDDEYEVAEQVEHVRGVGFRVPAFFALFLQILNDVFGMDFFLHIDGGRLHHQIGPILRVLAAPDQLRVAQFNFFARL